MLGAVLGGIGEGLITSAFNVWQGERSKDFNREMASTEHQREVKDLRAAGLNPVLSAGGGGSSVAAAPTPQAGNFDVTNKAIQSSANDNQTRLVNAQIRDINSAASLKEIDGRIKLNTEAEQIMMIQANLQKLLNDSSLSKAQRDKILEEISNFEIQRKLWKAQTDHSAAQAAGVDADAERKKAIAKPFEYLNKGIKGVEDNAGSWWKSTKKWFKDGAKQSKRRHDGKTGRW